LPAVAEGLAGLARLRSEHPAQDGSARLLVELADGQTVESVLLPPGRIAGLCVSTQVGCAVGCVFCMTGQSGLLRQLGDAEIVAQVALARAWRAHGGAGSTQAASPPSGGETGAARLRGLDVRKVVFMGMGEPAHNLDEVMSAIELLGQEGGIGHKQLVFSTVGDERVFERLPQGRVKPALALSLHTTKPALREQLLPRAPRIAPADLVEAGLAYARATGYPLQLQWTLIEGVNDGDDEVRALAAMLAGRGAVLNLIPYNRIEGLSYVRPAWERAAAMARALHRLGVLTKLRRSAAQDVDGGCGQLRARAAARPDQASVKVHRRQSAPPCST
jgi:23S rRNA (adenine2503-C2)-methyltransferase